MRILLTNDDGIDAEGLQILEHMARAVSDDVWIVAPATEQSGQSQALTLADPLRYAKLSDQRFAVSGTPADCVTMALNAIMDTPPDLVLSGVNIGFNIADDIPYSGTVGAALHAAGYGIRAIAFSQAYQYLSQDRERDIWTAARVHGVDTLKRLMPLDIGAGTILNVNFPPVPAEEVDGMMLAGQGVRASHELYTEDRIDVRNNPYHWLRFRREAGDAPADTDLGAMAQRRISVTPLRANLTDQAALDALRKDAAFS